jgi:hypothetical protein
VNRSLPVTIHITTYYMICINNYYHHRRRRQELSTTIDRRIIDLMHDMTLCDNAPMTLKERRQQIQDLYTTTSNNRTTIICYSIYHPRVTIH